LLGETGAGVSFDAYGTDGDDDVFSTASLSIISNCTSAHKIIQRRDNFPKNDVIDHWQGTLQVILSLFDAAAISCFQSQRHYHTAHARYA
jgi:hypothetical protein